MAKKKASLPQKSFLERIIGWGIILVFAVLPLLYFPNRAAAHVTSKEYFFIGIVDVLIVLWTWLLLVDKRYRLTKKNVLYLLPPFLFLASLTISAFVGVNPAKSFFSTVESGTGLIVLYHIAAFTCIIASFIRVQQKGILKYILQANLFSSVVLAIATFFTGTQHGLFDVHSSMLDGSSGGAMMGNELLVGAYFIFSIFLTLYLVFHESKAWRKALYIVGILFLIFSPIYFNVHIFQPGNFTGLISFIGNARIATVALVIGLLTSLFIWLSTLKDKMTWKLIGIVGIVFIIVGGIVGVQQLSSPNSSLHTFFVNESGNRIIDWQESLQGIKERPLLGWGPENFNVVYQKFLNPVIFNPKNGSEVWALHPHNNTLEVLINGGVIGFIFYALILVTLFGGLFSLYRKGRIDAKTYALLTGMLVAFILQQQMIYDSIVSYILFFSILALIAGLSDTTDSSRELANKSNVAYIIGTVVVIVMFPIWLYAAYLPAQKTDEFQADTTMTSDARTKVYDHLFNSPGSYAIDTDIEFFTDPLFYSYDPQKVALRANPTYQKVASTEIETLLATVDPIWQKNPYDYHLTLSLVQLENLDFYLSGNTKDLTQADIYAKRAFVLSPTDPQIYNAYAETLVYEKNIPAAIVLLDKAIALNQNYQAAVDFKALLEK